MLHFNRATFTVEETKTGKIGNTRRSVGHGRYSTAVINQTEAFWLLYRKTTLIGGAPL